MKNRNKLLLTDGLSSFGAGLSDIALITLSFMITQSAEITSYIISLRLLSSVLVFLALPRFLNFLSMRYCSFSTDLLRSLTCITLIFTWNIYLVAISAIVISFSTGINSAIKNVACQKFITSDERVAFLSKQQFIYGFFTLSAPLTSALLIKLFSVHSVFIIEGLVFLASSLTVLTLENWDPTTKSIQKGNLSGFKFILKDKNQLNILFFRLSILTSMMAYQVLSTYILTSNYKDLLDYFDLKLLNSYSDIIALFNTIATISLLIGSLITGKYFSIHNIKKSFLAGSILVSIGCILWATTSNENRMLFYIPGTFFIFIGLSLLRISLYTTGQELTDENHFSEIIVTSDLISRSYQSFISFFIVTIVTITSPSIIFFMVALSALFSMYFSTMICRKLSDRESTD